ncbi:Ras family GTPase, partial [uncultured virus]
VKSQSYNQGYDYIIKLLLVGDSVAGKSSILARYADDMFSETVSGTIGIDFKIKTIDRNGYRIRLQIWDTAGQERFRVITTAYYRGAMGVFIVYDTTNPRSFDNVSRWMKSLDEHISENTCLALLGNKSDLIDERAIDTDQGIALAKKLDIPFFEVSAKTGENVNDAFDDMVNRTVAKLQANAVTYNKPTSKINLITNPMSESTESFRCGCY